MSGKKVIIIGAGLAGLAAGIYARLNGFDTLIREHHTRPGGVLATWRRGDFRIDGGMHFLMHHQEGSLAHRLYQQLGVDPAEQRVRTMDLYARFVDQGSGRVLDLAADLSALEDAPQASAWDRRQLEKLARAARALAGQDSLRAGMALKPPELAGPLDKLSALWAMRRRLKYYTGEFNQPLGALAESLEDPFLGFVAASTFLPQVPVWFAALVLGLFSAGQLGLLTRGSGAFVEAMARRYEQLGGEIEYKSTVKRILTKNGRAWGVRTADGEEMGADWIVAAGDLHATLFDLLGLPPSAKRLAKRFESEPLIRPWVMLNLGLEMDLGQEPWFTQIRLEKPLLVAGERVTGLGVRNFSHAPAAAPQGQALLQVTFETNYQYWADLAQDRAAYKAYKDELAQALTQRLEQTHPGLAGRVRMRDLATPATTQRYTLNHQGAYMGWMPTPQALRTPVPRRLPGLRGLVLASQWVMPGGGVPFAMLSGRHAVQLMVNEAGRRFTPSL